MQHFKGIDGEVIASYYEVSDMPLCRACGARPVIKGKPQQSTRLECPICGIRTGMSTSDQAKFETWKKVMGRRDADAYIA